MLPTIRIRPVPASLVLAAMLALSACTALPNSNRRRGEKLTLRVVERPMPLAFDNLQSQALASRGLFLTLVSKAAPLVVQGIQELIKRDQAKYTAEYRLAQSNLYFYSAPSAQATLDPQNIKFKSLDIRRSVQLSAHDTTQATALHLRLDMLDDVASEYALLNNSVFRLGMHDLQLAYSKAKVPAAHWYLPWTLMYRHQQVMSLDLTVNILGSWIGADGTIHKSQPLGTALLRLRDVPLADPAALARYLQQQEGRVLDGYFHLVPRSTGSYLGANNEVKPGFGQGVYSVEVVVTETGKTNFTNKLIFDNVGELNQLPKLVK